MRSLLALLFLIPLALNAQQVADPDFHYINPEPLYAKGRGPIVLIDEAHNNFHTRQGRYYSFAQLLEGDGFRVKSLTTEITSESLEDVRMLVISNPMHKSTVGRWILPNLSAYTKEEIDVVETWVRKGGRLFLIADHMPFGGATEELAARFGFEFTNGFAQHPERRGPDFFKASEGTLLEHPVTDMVNQVATFTGQAFRIPKKADGLLRFSRGYINLLPDTAWRFNAKTPRVDVEGWYQGAVMKFGKGKLAVFGEAAMFTTQLAGAQKIKMGMNAPGAEQNPLFLLNLMAWLDAR